MSRGGLFRLGAFVAALVVIFTIYWAPALAGHVYTFLSALSPLWLPVLLAWIAWPVWLTFIRSQYASNIEYTTLELKPGDNTPKTAKPMELVFYSLYYRTDITPLDTFLKGVVRVPWAFEVEATNGLVRFYLHVPTHQRAAIETRLKAEYRDVDIDLARDYSREREFTFFTSRLEMREFTLAKPDPYPLRTYESHEHGKERRDVFQELLEELATVPQGQHVWISLMVRPHQRDWGHDIWAWREEPIDSLHEEARSEIQKLVGASGDIRGLPAVAQETVKAIERALQKPSFDCGLRVAYSADRDQWDEDRAASIEHMFDRFGDHTLNSFESYDPRKEVGWPLSDIFAALPALDMEYFLKLYRRRAFFAPPYYGRTFVLNTEELATLWHLPKVGRASALNRNRGSKLEPPENLPV